MEDLLIKLNSKLLKYEKVFGRKCSLAKIFELSSHMLGLEENNVLRSHFSSLNYPQNRQRQQHFLLRGQPADASFQADVAWIFWMLK